MTNYYKNISKVFVLASLLLNAGFLHAVEGDESGPSGVEVSKEDTQQSQEKLLETTKQIINEVLQTNYGFDGAKSLTEQVQQLNAQDQQELYERLEKNEAGLEALKSTVDQAIQDKNSRLAALEQGGLLTKEEKEALLENQLTAEERADLIASKLSAEEKQALTNNKESAQKIASLEKAVYRQNIVIGSVICVLCIYFLLQQKSVKALLKDPKAFFATVWGYVPSKQQARNFVELCADYTTSLRDLVNDRTNPEKAWRANPTRKAVGIIAPLAVIAGGTYAYKKREAIKSAGKDAGRKLQGLWPTSKPKGA